jgi:hypothetical protein
LIIARQADPSPVLKLLQFQECSTNPQSIILSAGVFVSEEITSPIRLGGIGSDKLGIISAGKVVRVRIIWSSRGVFVNLLLVKPGSRTLNIDDYVLLATAIDVG